MKNFLYLFLFIFAGYISSCKTPPPAPVPQTTLGMYTPYFLFPEQLNGKLKSVKEINYWALQTDSGVFKGPIITKNERDSLKWSNDFVASYSESGVITNTDYSNGSEHVSHWETEILDNKITKASFYKNDTLRRYDIFTFDESGFIDSEELFITADSSKRTLKYLNDSLGNWNKIKYYDNDNNLKRVYTFERDMLNRISMEYTYDQNDSLISTMQQTYNDHGFYNMSQSKNSLNEVNNQVKVEYTSYDEMKNWTNANIYLNDTLKVICDRIYEYY